MIYLLATSANDAEFMPSLLHVLAGELRVPLDAVAGEVWGVGYYAEDRALLVRKPSSILSDRSVFGVTPELRSRIVLAAAQAGHASDSPLFRFRRWLFAFCGDLTLLGKLQDKIADKLPDFIRSELGDGDGGRVAHAIFLAELHRAGALEDLLISPQVLKDAMSRFSDTVNVLVTESGLGEISAAYVASNGRNLILCQAGQPLYVKEVVGLEHWADGPLDEALHDFKHIAEALKRFKAKVVALDVYPGSVGWVPVTERTVWCVDAQLNEHS